ncbi:DinB family protein [Paenibacillus physcomitrellae]|uniref:DNA damage-inducible protein DinB n=1 Tax=Paenibacillus physcomitrellae TaxID=1619311 RepID=A0ABQ1FRP7_9BACL|nr:DinB family protein [Paenibacillus physcomitrellae]GGA25366.1 DNA damage-inducible protein DinB [Paenibacillus physcomitrellae]
MLEILLQQYNWISSARQNLFAFLEEIPPQILHQTVPNFGHGTIIRTHIHVADCYRFWLESFALKKLSEHKDTFLQEIEHADVKVVRGKFTEVDEIVQRFLHVYCDRWSEPIEQEAEWQGYPKTPTPLLLLTHVETHEFHHKGQILMMAKQLGCPPPTDDRLGGLFT